MPDASDKGRSPFEKVVTTLAPGIGVPQSSVNWMLTIRGHAARVAKLPASAVCVRTRLAGAHAAPAAAISHAALGAPSGTTSVTAMARTTELPGARFTNP